MRNTIRYVGLGVHKDTIVIAVADEGRDAPEVLGTIPNTWAALQKKLKRLGPKANLRCCLRGRPNWLWHLPRPEGRRDLLHRSGTVARSREEGQQDKDGPSRRGEVGALVSDRPARK